MSVGLYMDEHVPGAITRALRRRGVDVLTAQHDGREGASDEVLLSRATELGRVMFSFDSDMAREASERLQTRVSFAGLIRAHAMGITLSQAIEQLEMICKTSELRDMADRVEYLPLW